MKRNTRAAALFLFFAACLATNAKALDRPRPAPRVIRVAVVGDPRSQDVAAILTHLSATGDYRAALAKPDELLAQKRVFDLIIAVGCGEVLSPQELTASAGLDIPLLLLETGDFVCSKTLGLVWTAQAETRFANVTRGPRGRNRMVRLLGDFPRISTWPSRLCSVSEWQLTPSAAPRWYTTDGGTDVLAISASQRPIISYGAGDAIAWGPWGWRLFDLLVDELAPVGPTHAGLADLGRALRRSELEETISMLDPSVNNHVVVELVFESVRRWNLYELVPWLESLLAERGFAGALSPRLESIGTMLAPRLREDAVLEESLEPARFEERWMVGAHSDGSVPDFGAWITGADLGIGARLLGKTYLYLGDTVPSRSHLPIVTTFFDRLLPFRAVAVTQLGELSGCSPAQGFRPECNDGILVLEDRPADPSGHDRSLVLEDRDPRLFRPQALEGVHSRQSVGLWSPRANGDKMPFSVPTGAVTIPGDRTDLGVDAPIVALWYTTHCSNEETATSWLGCSVDGVRFRPCRRVDASEPRRFEELEKIPYHPLSFGDYGEKIYRFLFERIDGPRESFADPPVFPFSRDKFIKVAPLWLGPEDLARLENPPPSKSGAGLLLFGTGSPNRCSAVHMAFIDAKDFGTGENALYYHETRDKKPTWVTSEDTASPLGVPPRCLRNREDFDRYGVDDMWDDMQTTAFAVYYSLARSTLDTMIADCAPGCPHGRIDLRSVGLSDSLEHRRLAAAAIAAFSLASGNDEFVFGYPERSAFGEIAVTLHRDSGTILLTSNHTQNQNQELEPFFRDIGAQQGRAYVDVTTDAAVHLAETFPVESPFEATDENIDWWTHAVQTIDRALKGPDRWIGLDLEALDDIVLKDYDWSASKIYWYAAPIEHPEQLTAQTSPGGDTLHFGYGAYFLPGQMRIVDYGTKSRLRFGHVVSKWNGPALPGVYGVYSTQSEIPCERLLWNSDACRQ